MLLSTAYLPSIAWCSEFWNADLVVLEACENYQKGTLRNRAYLAGPNGVQRLSIPLVKGKHQQTNIREVRIAYEQNWQRQHLRTIRTAYGNAPYFEHYIDDLTRYYTDHYEFLFDYNLALIEFVLVEKMGWVGEIGFSEVFDPTPGPSPAGEGGCIELCDRITTTLAKIDADDLSQGTQADKGYTNPSQGAQAAIVSRTLLPSPAGEGSGVGSYPQVFQEKHGFLPNLSILDLLFCCGKHGGEILAQSKQKRS